MAVSDEAANEIYKEKIRQGGFWINEEFLREVLGSSLEEDVEILEYEVNAAVGAGDNYLSILHRAHVTYKIDGSEDIETIQLMVKSLPIFSGEFVREIIEEMGAFDKEISIYGECIPLMHKLLKTHFPRNTSNVAPNSYKSPRPNTVIMEDLTASGYKMAIRQDQLDFEHAKAAICTLARFHALSIKIFETQPEIITKSTREIYRQELGTDQTAQLVNSASPSMARAIGTWSELSHRKYAEDIRQIGSFMYDKAIHLTRRSENLNVMNHGDFWINNVMFKYRTDGSIHSAKLIDFQIARFTAPSVDIHYFFCTSVRPEVLQNRMFLLLDIYHEALMGDLALLDVNADYPIEQLHEDMRDRAGFTLIPLLQVLPMILAPAANAATFETDPDEYPLAQHFRFPRYAEVCGKFLENFESVGYLNEAKVRLRGVEEAAKARLAETEEERNNNREEFKDPYVNSLYEEEEEDDVEVDKTKIKEISTLQKFWRMLTTPLCE